MGVVIEEARKEVPVDEDRWFRLQDAGPMLEWLEANQRPSERKVRLFLCSFLWTVCGLLPDEASLRAIAVAERFADGDATAAELARARWEAFELPVLQSPDRTVRRLAQAAHDAATAAGVDLWHEGLDRWGFDDMAEGVIQAPLLRDLIGNPFRPVTFNPSWRSWDGGTVRDLAATMYSAKAFDRMPVLADALEDAGCTDADILRHCRGPGPHVRGCWVVDLILDRT
jgi:hypothetical protein